MGTPLRVPQRTEPAARRSYPPTIPQRLWDRGASETIRLGRPRAGAAQTNHMPMAYTRRACGRLQHPLQSRQRLTSLGPGGANRVRPNAGFFKKKRRVGPVSPPPASWESSIGRGR